MALLQPTAGRVRQYLPSYGKLALIATLGLILMLILLVAIAIYVASQRPPVTPLTPDGPIGDGSRCCSSPPMPGEKASEYTTL